MSTGFFNNCDDETEELESAKQFADLARDWAIKLDGQVDGIDFSSKYWAQQAAMGAGLRITIKEDGTPIGDDFTVLNFGAGLSATQTATNEVLLQSTGEILVETLVDGVDFIAGTDDSIALDVEVVSKNNIDVYRDGIYQNKDTYDVSGVLLTFDEIIPIGVEKIEVIYPNLLDVGITSADNITYDGSNVETALDSLFLTSGQNETDIAGLTARVTTNEADILSLDGRLTIVERSTLVNRPFPNVQAVKDATFLQTGDIVEWVGYTTAGDGGGNKGEIVAAGTGTDDGGSYIDLPGSGLQARGLFPGGEIRLEQFGYPSLSTARANALAYAKSVSLPVTLLSSVTFRIPTDSAAMQDIFDFTVAANPVEVTVLIVTGHQPESGISVSNGDYGNYIVASEDAEVTLGAGFSGDFISASYARAPVLGCLVDSSGLATRGYEILAGQGRVLTGCGVKNVSAEALWVYHSILDAPGGVWSGAGTYAMRMSRGTIFNASDSDCTNCTGGQNGIIYVNRGSIGNIQFTDLSGCQAEKILYSHRASKLNAHNIVADGCVIDNPDLPFAGFAVANRASELDINSSDVTNLNGKFISTAEGGTLNAANMTSTVNDVGSGAYNCIENRSGTVIFGGTVTGFRDGLNQSGGTTTLASTTITSPGRNGIDCTDGGVVNAVGVAISNAGNVGANGRYGAQLVIRAGSIKNSAGDDINLLDGSYAYAHDCETTNGVGGPDVADTSPSSFNTLTNRGILFA